MSKLHAFTCLVTCLINLPETPENVWKSLPRNDADKKPGPIALNGYNQGCGAGAGAGAAETVFAEPEPEPEP